MSKNLSFLSAMEDRDDMSIEDIVGQVTSAISAPAPGSRARMRTAGLPSDKVPFASCHSLCPGSAQLGECRRLLHLYEIDNKALKSRCGTHALRCPVTWKVLNASKRTGYRIFCTRAGRCEVAENKNEVLEKQVCVPCFQCPCADSAASHPLVLSVQARGVFSVQARGHEDRNCVLWAFGLAVVDCRHACVLKRA